MNRSAVFSVIVPTHLRPRLLHRALESIKAQVADVPVEVIVVSDAIDPATEGVCNTLLGASDIYLRRNGLRGPSESRNVGMSLASGQYILFLDDDDAWHPNFIEQLWEAIHLNPAQCLYVNCSVVKESRRSSEPEFLSETFLNLQNMLTPEVFVKNQVHMSCCVFPKYLLKGLEFDKHMRAYEDWDFQLSAFERNFPMHVPIVGSRIFEVDDASTDRRGSSQAATDLNAVFDYLYVYRRHPGPTEAIKERRQNLLSSVGLSIDVSML
jgi:glycosyltransferase involved in cell wall biosynthesis